ncbi:Tricarboxylate/iron carrier [Penicillium waksmanii]|uniref:Tricarboxylate/iron carrier n=1 Tax=Penicillium waksmanii TaxID=69791 RepID=UPI0025482146|nr:Tricarboxylate/iron carrier [Penicillium waksmanii]KAJ5987874.1 Tricarboxylate/iron carrier [Penicillium waksmanii]
MNLATNYKNYHAQGMRTELWQAKKIVDSTLHPDTWKPVLLPFRMLCYVFSNLIVKAGILIPGVTGEFWDGRLPTSINSANTNQSTPLSTEAMIKSYFMAVSTSCSVALGLNSMVPWISFVSQQTKTILARLVPFAALASAGALNVFLMRGEEFVV